MLWLHVTDGVTGEERNLTLSDLEWPSGRHYTYFTRVAFTSNYIRFTEAGSILSATAM